MHILRNLWMPAFPRDQTTICSNGIVFAGHIFRLGQIMPVESTEPQGMHFSLTCLHELGFDRN